MTRNRRKRILAKYSTTHCIYCGVSMTLPYGKLSPTDATIEHFLPMSRGGCKNDFVVACRGCNSDKRDLTLNEWRAVLAVRYVTIPVFWFERVALKVLWLQAGIELNRFAVKLGF